MDSLGLYDIYEYRHLPFWQTTLFKMCFMGGICIIIAALMWCFVRYLSVHKKRNYWVLWHNNLEALRTKKVANTMFYAALATNIKECAVIKLHATESLTDLELALFLKSGDFPEHVRILGEILERASVYKFDPMQREHVDQQKELEYIYAALHVLKQMEQKQ